MNRFRKHRKGFSLIEMVLAIAIVMIIGGVIIGLCASISNSFIATYTIDEAADYALLYAKGFENSFLKNTQVPEGVGQKNYTWTWRVYKPGPSESAMPTLTVKYPNQSSYVDVFTPQYLSNTNTAYKWNVYMFYKFEGGDTGNKLVRYRIFITDHANPSSDFIYSYSGSFWLPRYDQRASFQGVGDTRTITLGGSQMSDTYMGLNSTQKNAVSGLLDSSYQSEISFKWG